LVTLQQHLPSFLLSLKQKTGDTKVIISKSYVPKKSISANKKMINWLFRSSKTKIVLGYYLQLSKNDDWIFLRINEEEQQPEQ